MKFTLLINPTNNWEETNSHACQLAQAIIKDGHQLLAVFFYGESVKITTHTDCQGLWQDLQQNHPVKLLVCRTMLDTHKLNKPSNKCFLTVGMGQLTLNMEQADKTMEIS